MRDDVVTVHQALDSLRLTMQHPARVAAGDVIMFEFDITNVSDRAIDLYLGGRDVTIDISIRDAAGNRIWHNLAGVAIPAILQLRPLAPNASLHAREEWTVPADVDAGDYAVAAELLGESERLPFAASTLQLRR